MTPIKQACCPLNKESCTMRILILATIFLLLVAEGLQAQGTKEENDPKAKAILDKVRKKYESYPSLEMEFSLTVEIPEQPKDVQRGKMMQKGSKYRLEMSGQTVICDGKSLWMVMPQNKEVQINHLPDAEEDDAILSPQSFFRIHEKGNLAYILSNEYSANGKIFQEIEFKPLDKFSDYAKLRLTVNKASAEFVELKGFGKDGSRYTLAPTRFTPNKVFAESVFLFNKAAYPGYHIEDLRN
jgi:outer membrane lipoprotein-sorting protein